MPIMDKKNSEWFNEIEDTAVDEFDNFDDDIDWDALERELDISDEEYTDEELANIYGGDLTYCPNCGKRLAMDDGYSYCPDCEPKDTYDYVAYDRYDNPMESFKTEKEAMDYVAAQEDFDRVAKVTKQEGVREIVIYSESDDSDYYEESASDDTLVEAPVVKLSDDQLNDPSEVNFSKMIRDAEEKERAEKEEAERLARKDELSQKYSGVIYSIQKVNNTDEPGIEINRLEAAFAELVPSAGKADTVAGEIVRATMRIIYRYYNDGDYFFMGYGLETAAPSAAYLSDRYEDTISEGMEIGQVFANEYGINDKELDEKYEKFLKTLADVVVQDIIDNPELIEEENDVDSRDFDPEYIVDEQPRFETDFMLSQDVQDLYDADIVTTRDIRYYVEGCFEWESQYEGCEISYDGGDYVYLSNLTYDGFYDISERFKGYNGIEKFWEEFVEEYADQLEEYRNGEDEEYEEEDGTEYDDEGEDYSESFHRQVNSVKINPKNDCRIRESLANRLVTGDLDYNTEIDSLGAEENGVTIDIQDRESHTHEKRGPRRWASPRVTSNSWGRIWKDGECEQFTGSKNEVRSKMLKRLRDMDEDLGGKFVLDKTIISENDLPKGIVLTDNGAHDLETAGKSGRYIWVGYSHGRGATEYRMHPVVKEVAYRIADLFEKKYKKKATVDNFLRTTDMMRVYVENDEINEDFNYSSNSYKLETADDILSTLVDNLDDEQIDSVVTITERIAKKLKVKRMSELYVLTIEDEYSPDWTMATREGKPQRAGGQNIQYWTLGGNLFAELRINGQAMLFFNDEDAAKDYISSVDEENLYEGLDRVIYSDELKTGDKFEVAETVYYGEIDDFPYYVGFENLEGLSHRECAKELRKMGFMCEADSVLIAPGTKGEVVGFGQGGPIFKVNGVDMDFCGDEFAVKLLNDLDESVDNEIYDLPKVEADLKSITNDFTMPTGTVKCYSEEEKDHGVAVLNKHYNEVTVSEDGECYALTFANKIEESINEGYHNNSEEYAPYFPEEYSLYDEQTPNFFIQTTKVSLNGEYVGTIQKHPKRGGSRRNDSNRVTSTYYIAIPKNGDQKMVDTPEEAVKAILGKLDTIKESAYNADALRRFRDKQLNK